MNLHPSSAVADVLGLIDQLSPSDRDQVERVILGRRGRLRRAELVRLRCEAVHRFVTGELRRPAVTLRHFERLVADLVLIEPRLARGRRGTIQALNLRRCYFRWRRSAGLPLAA